MHYKISLWSEKPITIMNNNVIVNEYRQEQKLTTISSDTLTSPIAAYNPKLTRKINGEKTLSFSLNYKYYDIKEGIYKDNPYLSLLVNERLIKLELDDEVMAFVITNVIKSSDKKTIQCDCTELNIRELSKNGYNIILDTELENNMGTIQQLAESVLDDSQWNVVGAIPHILSNGKTILSDTIKAYADEVLYVYQLTSDLTATKIATSESVTISSGNLIYISTTSYNDDDTAPITFIWKQGGDYRTDEDRIIINADIYTAAAPFTRTLTELHVSPSYCGRFLQTQHLTKYVPQIDEYCYRYHTNNPSIEYYVYFEQEYLNSVEIYNLIQNNINFTDNSGWTNATTTFVMRNNKVVNLLSLSLSSGVTNSGVEDNKSAFAYTKGYNTDEDYILAVKVQEGTGLTGGTIYARSNDCDLNTAFTSYYTTQSTITITDTTHPLYGYNIWKLHTSTNLSYSNLLNSVSYLQLTGSGNVNIEDIKLFPEKYSDDAHRANYLIVPNLSTVEDATVRNKAYVFPKTGVTDDITSKNDLTYSKICYKEELAANGYYPIYTTNNELVTSISASESNRFNLIQDLCEKFQCWARFYVDTDNTGRTLYQYQNTSDTNYHAGKQYYSSVGAVTPGTWFNDENFRYLVLDPYFIQQTSQSIYQYNNKDNYYIKLSDGSYINANLGYQWGQQINGVNTVFYIAYYSTDATTGIETRNFRTATTYTSTETYYIKINDNYKPVVVTNDFTTSPTVYYVLNNWTPANIYEKHYEKYVTFNEYTGTDNYAGFKYGINLNNITRKLESESIVTKLIVAANSNEYAEHGSCSIQDAVSNYGGSAALYNFNYYINKGLINADQINRDLYGDGSSNCLAYLTKYYLLNRANKEITNELTQLIITTTKVDAQYQVYLQTYNSAKEGYEDNIGYIMEAKSCTYAQAAALTRNDSTQSDVVNSYITARDTYKSTMENTDDIVSTLLAQSELYHTKLNNLYKQQENDKTIKKALDSELFQRYNRFIQEGTWTSEDYVDPELYYYDACKVLNTSAYPQVSYTFKVTDLSELSKWKDYNFNIGDKTYIRDTEFFSDQGVEALEVIVTQIEQNLTDPQKNTITVANYATRFEDLFQRVAAATQTLQYNEGKYNYASEVTSDEQTGASYVKKMLEQNIDYISSINNGLQIDVAQGTITGSANVQNVGSSYLKITPMGILISNTDKPEDWRTAISAKGINADVMTTGTLNADKISIFGGSENELFRWDKRGISAFATINNGWAKNQDKFVRYDQNGLYGMAGVNYNTQYTLAQIKANAIFALTWDGLAIRAINNNNFVKISTEGTGTETIWNEKKIIDAGIGGTSKFYVTESGNVYANSGYFTGTLQANQIKLYKNNTWQNIIDVASAKINGEYINAKGITVSNGSTTTFAVDSSTGAVTINGATSISGNITMTSGSITWANVNSDPVAVSAASTASTALSDVYDLAVGAYTKGGRTFIDGTNIYSPNIMGDQIVALGSTLNHSGTFKIAKLTGYDANDNPTYSVRGYMGYATGATNQGSITEGIALTTGNPASLGSDPMVIVTDAGARMSAGVGSASTGATILVTSTGAYYRQPGESTLSKIGSGTAVFG